ncbi:hypothetical protein [Helicobacter fennelliae]|uniref:Uncharacterized protein n=1 Tax=Helicobacter fennelliae MRY12-0050 TaxID=1325130 RepID=T1CPX5_9HELI|nr:hypothetical protein [Helicobacter fennelliae]GAD18809.1 hypothetical protein HFN_2221 [Helicobacter fennelliae MRY12-0050]
MAKYFILDSSFLTSSTLCHSERILQGKTTEESKKLTKSQNKNNAIFL